MFAACLSVPQHHESELFSGCITTAGCRYIEKQGQYTPDFFDNQGPSDRELRAIVTEIFTQIQRKTELEMAKTTKTRHGRYTTYTVAENIQCFIAESYDFISHYQESHRGRRIAVTDFGRTQVEDPNNSANSQDAYPSRDRNINSIKYTTLPYKDSPIRTKNCIRFLTLFQHAVLEDTRDLLLPSYKRKYQDAFVRSVNQQLIKDILRAEWCIDGENFSFNTWIVERIRSSGDIGGVGIPLSAQSINSADLDPQLQTKYMDEFQVVFLQKLESFLMKFCKASKLGERCTDYLIRAVTTQMCQCGLANLDKGSRAGRYLCSGMGMEQVTVYSLSSSEGMGSGENGNQSSSDYHSSSDHGEYGKKEKNNYTSNGYATSFSNKKCLTGGNVHGNKTCASSHSGGLRGKSLNGDEVPSLNVGNGPMKNGSSHATGHGGGVLSNMSNSSYSLAVGNKNCNFQTDPAKRHLNLSLLCIKKNFEDYFIEPSELEEQEAQRQAQITVGSPNGGYSPVKYTPVKDPASGKKHHFLSGSSGGLSSPSVSIVPRTKKGTKKGKKHDYFGGGEEELELNVTSTPYADSFEEDRNLPASAVGISRESPSKRGSGMTEIQNVRDLTPQEQLQAGIPLKCDKKSYLYQFATLRFQPVKTDNDEPVVNISVVDGLDEVCLLPYKKIDTSKSTTPSKSTLSASNASRVINSGFEI